ncbi:MAG: hypothetical protein WBA00_00520, partial [Rhodococcus sp. (in: high G+C Gram-positive bacteria)]
MRVGGIVGASILVLSAVTMSVGSTTASSAQNEVAMAAAESARAVPGRETMVGLVEPSARSPIAFASPAAAAQGVAATPAAPLS